MTASPRRRSRRTVAGATIALGLVLIACAMFFVGVITLSNSKEGEAVGIDDRPHVDLPATPNALLAVTDDEGRLASVVVLTLLPQGQGGSVVTVPVNADATAGFGLQRRPLDESFDAADPDAFVGTVEDMLSISIERVEIVDPAGLEAMLAPVESVQVVLPDAVIDTGADGSTSSTSLPTATPGSPSGDGSESEDEEPDPGLVMDAGPQVVGPADVVIVLTAIDDDAPVVGQHANDVAMWSALALTAPTSVPPEPVATDTDGFPVPPVTVGELFTRLWQGEVGVRDLAASEPTEDTNPTGVDVVVLDRTDVALVFAQVSPALVSTPNIGLKTRIVAPFTAEQLEVSDGRYDSNSELARELIGQLLFLQGNVVSVDTAPAGAPEITILEVSDARWIADTQIAADLLFGPSEVRVATTVLDGVDLEVTLGTAYFQRQLNNVTPDAGSTPGSGTVGEDG